MSLLNWTEQGIRNVRDTAGRANRAAEVLEKHGGRFEQLYWTVGPYDLVAIIEGLDDGPVTAALLEIGTAGDVRTTTLRTFNREEMAGIVERLG